MPTLSLPYPFGSPWVRSAISRYLLPVWFAAIGIKHVWSLAMSGFFSIDARIYIEGTRAWLMGGNPWDAYVDSPVGPLHFAAPPPNLVPLVPFALLPDPVGALLMVAVSAAAGVFLVRRLGLPWWWILFPPLLEGMQSGNPQVILTALLVAGGRAAMLAPTLKVYAIIPLVLLGRRREVVGGVVVLAVASLLTATLWPVYLVDFGAIAIRLAHQSAGGYSAWALPWLLPITLIAIILLLVLDRERGAWLAVPALWPSSEFHYDTFAMPIARRSLPWLLAIPSPLTTPVVAVILATGELVRRARRPRDLTAPGQMT